MSTRARTFLPATRKARWSCALAGLLLLVAVTVHGSIHRPLAPAAGERLLGPPPIVAALPALRVASFNIHGCRDAEGTFSLQRTVKALQGYDLVGLNEVHGQTLTGRPDQAALLGEQLRRSWLFAPTTRRWWQDDFGNGFLCRLPIRQWKRIPLAGTRRKGHRNMLVIEVIHGQHVVHVLITHLDRVQDRARQLEEVSLAFLALPRPAMLMGDLNTTAEDPQLSRLLARPDVRDLVAEGLAAPPPRRIDWILGRGLRCMRSGVEDTGASDHPLVWAEIEPAQDL